ncbi:hypothetical protein T12_5712 [Trichinella patagoniensis]|uniref:Uncharacterized protein n=1 Tax=Trichinella patagoniensis TaxID=990121 RepID=A0A0V0Z629_9BILA|nr:hypothetical protein T12_5712 [Trichinella patagoniensis]
MRRQLKVQHRRQKALYDRKATQGTFRVKDLVWLAIPRGGKLHLYDTYEIVQTLGPHTYRVRHQERRRALWWCHRLKKYVTWEDADETRRRPFPLWYGSGNYPKEQQPKENVTGPRVEVLRPTSLKGKFRTNSSEGGAVWRLYLNIKCAFIGYDRKKTKVVMSCVHWQ